MKRLTRIYQITDFIHHKEEYYLDIRSIFIFGRLFLGTVVVLFEHCIDIEFYSDFDVLQGINEPRETAGYWGDNSLHWRRMCPAFCAEAQIHSNSHEFSQPLYRLAGVDCLSALQRYRAYLDFPPSQPFCTSYNCPKYATHTDSFTRQLSNC